MFKSKGFTLVELLLVMAIIAAVFLFSAPYTTKFYVANLVNDTQSNIIDALGRAQHNAVLQKNDSKFGVYISIASSSYTLFQGNSYAERVQAQDEVFPVVSSIVFSTTTEIVFSKLTGLPNATGTVSLVYGNYSKGVAVADSGVISTVSSGSSSGSSGSSGCQITTSPTVVPVGSVYTFTSNGTFTVTSGTCDAEILVVGGGGGGGSERAGGGAGGQIYHSSSEIFSVGDYAVTIGDGGAGGTGFGGAGSDGEASSLGDTYSALGGEHGTGNNAVPGSRGVPGTGANGGGSGGYGSNIGGSCNNTTGTDGSLFLSEYWAGGGGGGGWECNGMAGGAGGGGKGGDGSPEISHGTSGTPNTGGGGGGSNGWSGGGGDGGSGIVIVKLLN